jgi:hypothetical protein
VADFEKEKKAKEVAVKRFQVEPKEVRGLRLMDELESFYALEKELLG